MESRHHLCGEELHGAHDLVVLHAGEGEVTPEIAVCPLLLQSTHTMVHTQARWAAIVMTTMRPYDGCDPGRQAVSTERIVTKSWIQTSPGVCGGEPCVRNTRHTVSGLVEWKQQGLTDARILEHHPDLTPADLDAAWAYYATHREEIDQAIKEAADA